MVRTKHYLEANHLLARVLVDVLHRSPWCQVQEVQHSMILKEVVFVARVEPRDDCEGEGSIGPERDQVRGKLATTGQTPNNFCVYSAPRPPTVVECDFACRCFRLGHQILARTSRVGCANMLTPGSNSLVAFQRLCAEPARQILIRCPQFLIKPLLPKTHLRFVSPRGAIGSTIVPLVVLRLVLVLPFTQPIVSIVLIKHVVALHELLFHACELILMADHL
jgi:hypothetical protein